MTLGKTLLAAVLYAAVALGANPVFAADPHDLTPDYESLRDLRRGDMRKLAIPDLPKKTSEAFFLDAEDLALTLGEFRGRTVLVNFWATWCAPCRAEMPSLDALQRDLGGEDFQVVTIATGRNPLPAIRKFFIEVGVTDLPILRDPQRTLSRDMGVFGLPTSVLLSPDGREIARLTGDADWYSEDAVSFLNAAIELGQNIAGAHRSNLPAGIRGVRRPPAY